MALDIDGASIGYDQGNMISTLNHVHNNCVQSAKNALRANIANLRNLQTTLWIIWNTMLRKFVKD